MFKVMIVEDEVIVAQTIAAMLRQLGHQVVGIFSTGQEAIQKAAETRPDIVLMDIILRSDSEIDGINAASCIRKQWGIPVIYLTAYADDATLERAKQTQPVGYLVKPINELNLKVALEIGLAQHYHTLEGRVPDPLDVLFSCMSDGVIATDQQGQVTFMNPAAEHMTGWSRQEAIGQSITDVLNLVDQRTQEPIANPVLQAIRDRQVVYLQAFATLVTRNGHQIAIGDSVSPLTNQGQPNGAVLVFWDLSQRHTNINVAPSLAKELELKQLHDRFTDLLARQFRTPLNTILSSTGLLQLYGSRWSEARNEEQLAQIETAVEQMNQLLESITLIAQTERVSQVLAPAPLNLLNFYRELLQLLLQEDDRAAERIQLNIDPIVTTVILDERLLHHILYSLLSNALKYSNPDTSIQFEIITDLKTQTITFRIEDSGRGIPTADQARIFEPFYRGSNIDAIPGFGLGLAIVLRCVNLQEGEIFFASTVDVGTTFIVKLRTQLP